MKYIIIIILLATFVSAIEVDFDCPETVTLNEEFTCSLELFNATDLYDFKFNLQENGKTIAKIWNEEESSWKSTWNYLPSFIGNEEKKEIRLKIESIGEFQDLIKLRQKSKIESFNFAIKVEEPNEEIIEEPILEGVIEEEEVIEEPTKKVIQKEETSKEVTINEAPKEKKIITLSNPKTEQTEKLIYKSKNSKIISFLPYAFSIFLILIIIILLREKF
ncbi:MAG: hypothetical protein NUV97_00740 [archaeon]|nr:hypothetical protein [archaeon]MCR4323356.1 hypothetical protein [Nanoarchaeota archaeon]